MGAAFLLHVDGVFGEEPTAAVTFEMVVEGKSPYPLDDREALSLNCGGSKGVLIAPGWALTASHCITWRKQKAGKVNVSFSGENGNKVKIKVDKIVRHKSKDLALLRLVRPLKAAERAPVLLLRETLTAADGKRKIKKVAGNAAWRDIPGVGKNDKLSVPNEKDRQGKAGTSGSPWLLHSPQVGDVLSHATL